MALAEPRGSPGTLLELDILTVELLAMLFPTATWWEGWAWFADFATFEEVDQFVSLRAAVLLPSRSQR